MGIQNKALQSLGNVKAFRGYSVVGGILQLTIEDYAKHLDNTYAPAVVCNVSFDAGDALFNLSPSLFFTGKEEFQQELQAMLEGQLIQGNDVDIDFHV